MLGEDFLEQVGGIIPEQRDPRRRASDPPRRSKRVVGVLEAFKQHGKYSMAENVLFDRMSLEVPMPAGKDKKAAERALLSSPINDGPNVLEEYIKKWFNLRAFLQQADVPLSPSKFFVISAGMGLGGMILLPIHSATGTHTAFPIIR